MLHILTVISWKWVSNNAEFTHIRLGLVPGGKVTGTIMPLMTVAPGAVHWAVIQRWPAGFADQRNGPGARSSFHNETAVSHQDIGLSGDKATRF